MRRWAKRVVAAVLLLLLAPLAGLLVLAVLNQRTPAATNLADSAQLAAPPPKLREPVTLKVATYNIWDLYLISSNRKARMAAIAEKVASLDLDVIGFQEAWVESDRAVIIDALREKGLAHNRYFRSGLLGSGLLVVSRWPFAEAHFERYRQGGHPHRLDHGDWWAGKGVCLVRIELPEGAGFVDFFNTHAHARYGGHIYESVRMAQMQQLAAYIRNAATGTSPALVVGDFNAAAGQEQYAALVKGARLRRLMSVKSRVDHIFAVEDQGYDFEILSTEPLPEEVDKDGETFVMSDHTGYVSVIRISPRDAV